MKPNKPTGCTGRDAQSEFERHEAKYIIPRALVPKIREFIAPFCAPDPNAAGSPPEYIITTLQLDSPTLTLHYAKEREELNRFKLRVRTYGENGSGPLFVEIKRKIHGVVLKSRALVPRERWGGRLFEGRMPDLPFRSDPERANFLEFRRLVEAIAARPTMLIRYIRESYFGTNDRYARVTFDRRIEYRPTSGWDMPPPASRWRPMDSALALNRPWSGLILELKTYRDAPEWMVELTERFDLTRTGFSKYSTAMRVDALRGGATCGAGSENGAALIMAI